VNSVLAESYLFSSSRVVDSFCHEAFCEHPSGNYPPISFKVMLRGTSLETTSFVLTVLVRVGPNSVLRVKPSLSPSPLPANFRAPVAQSGKAFLVVCVVSYPRQRLLTLPFWNCFWSGCFFFSSAVYGGLPVPPPQSSTCTSLPRDRWSAPSHQSSLSCSYRCGLFFLLSYFFIQSFRDCSPTLGLGCPPSDLKTLLHGFPTSCLFNSSAARRAAFVPARSCPDVRFSASNLSLTLLVRVFMLAVRPSAEKPGRFFQWPNGRGVLVPAVFINLAVFSLTPPFRPRLC